jgi:beta-lactamase class A
LCSLPTGAERATCQTSRVSTAVSSLPGAVAAVCEPLGLRAHVHARDLATDAETGVDADDAVVLASVFKVPIAVELARQFESGELQPTERIRVPAGGRTSGGTGISALVDEIDMSLRDLAQLMISVSDNAATDIVMARVGRDAINARMRDLGLCETVLEGDCAFVLGRLVHDLDVTDAERARLERGDEEVFSDIPLARWQACRDLQPAATNRSTPREITRLLELVWKDEAAPPQASAFVRRIMGQQVWPHRLRAGFPGSVKTSSKTGTLPFVRNEAGVVEYNDGGRYAVAVFTMAATPALLDPNADRAIGSIARLAVDALRTA